MARMKKAHSGRFKMPKRFRKLKLGSFMKQIGGYIPGVSTVIGAYDQVQELRGKGGCS